MAVNLEELALKSIEQYAAFSVRLASMETAIAEHNRKVDLREDKLSIVLNTVTRLEEKMIAVVAENARLERRINTLTADLQTLTVNVNNLLNGFSSCSSNIKEHEDTHCDDCGNTARLTGVEEATKKLTAAVDALSAKVELMLHPDIVEVRTLITTKHGLQWLRFMVSRYGMWWMVAVTASVLIVFWSQYEAIKALWNYIRLGA